MLKNASLLILALLIMFGCKEVQQSEDSKTLRLEDLLKNKVEFKASDFFDQAEYVILQQGKPVVSIPATSHMKLYDDYILFPDIVKMSLYVFKRNGEFIDQIDNHGKGPGEFIMFYDFGLTSNNDEIFLFEQYAQKIHFYTPEGDWVRTVKLETPAVNINIEKNGNILTVNDQFSNDNFDDAGVLLLDPKGKVIEKLLVNYDEKATRNNKIRTFWLSQHEGGRLFRLMPDNNTFLNIDSDYKISQFIKFEDIEPQKTHPLINPDQYKADQAKSVIVHSIREINKDLFILAKYKGKWVNILYNPKTGESSYSDDIYDDLLGIRSFNITLTESCKSSAWHYNIPYAKENDTYIFDHTNVPLVKLQEEIKEKIDEADDILECVVIINHLKTNL